MKFPFVSRELYDRAVHEAETWRAEYLGLQRIILAKPEPAPVVEVVRAKAEPSLLAETIQAESNGNPRLAAHFWKRVRELRKDGKSDGDIADELSKWQTTEQDEVVA